MNNYKLQYVYLKEPTGTIKGPYPIMGTVEESIVEDIAKEVTTIVSNNFLEQDIVTEEYLQANYYTKEVLDELNSYVTNNLPDPTENENCILRSNGVNWTASQEEQVDLTNYVTNESAAATYATKEELQAFDALPKPTTEHAILIWDNSAKEWVAQALSIYTGEN